MQINTQQLRAALQTASDNIVNHQQNRTGDAKVENLNLRNVYISSKGEVHVSKDGWSRMWAGLMGRNTGEAALRQAMTGTGANGYKIPERVADRALQNITKFQEHHSKWSADHRALERSLTTLKDGGFARLAGGLEEQKAKINQSKAQEPSRNLEGVVGHAAKEIRQDEKKAALESAAQLGTAKADAFARSVADAPGSLEQLKSTLGGAGIMLGRVPKGSEEEAELKATIASLKGHIEKQEAAEAAAADMPVDEFDMDFEDAPGETEISSGRNQPGINRDKSTAMPGNAERATPSWEGKGVDDIAKDMEADIKAWGERNDGGAKMEADNMDARRESPQWKEGGEKSSKEHIEKHKENPLGNMPEAQKRQIEEKWRV